jgi:hypothetical protein
LKRLLAIPLSFIKAGPLQAVLRNSDGEKTSRLRFANRIESEREATGASWCLMIKRRIRRAGRAGLAGWIADRVRSRKIRGC